MNKPLTCVFMGTPEFSVPTLDYLNHSNLVDLKAVISMPDRPAGRGHALKSPEVIDYAKAHKITFYQSSNINADISLLEEVTSLKPDLIIVLAFAQFLNKKWLELARIGVFNIHTSLLPRYRGAAPIQAAIRAGDSHTGVSIQRMVKKMDAGDLVLEKEVALASDENASTLTTRLKFEAALACHDFLTDVTNDQLVYTPQDETLVSFAPTIKKQDGLLDFSQSTSTSLIRQLLAYDSWPGTYCFINHKRFKIFGIIPRPDVELQPGVISVRKDQIFIGSKDSAVEITELQPEGKKRMTSRDFIRGLDANSTLKLTEAL